MEKDTGPSAPSRTDGVGRVRGRRDEILAPADRTDTDPHHDGQGADHSPADAALADARSLNPTDSPCVALCSTLYDDVCRGCGRTVFEVANWVFMDETEKHEVWVRIRSQGFPRRRAPRSRHAPGPDPEK